MNCGQWLVARWRYFWRSESACAECQRSERPWRRMMVYPLGSTFAYICSDSCWDRFETRTVCGAALEAIHARHSGTS